MTPHSIRTADKSNRIRKPREHPIDERKTMKRSGRLLTMAIALIVTIPTFLVAASPASANVGQYQCDDGGGGITSHTGSSQCAQYYAYYSANYTGCTTSISDEPMGAMDTLTVDCGWGWVTPPWYIPFPPTAAEPQRCAYGSTAITDAGCGAKMPIDSPEIKQLMQDLHDGSFVAGAGAPLGSAANPMKLPSWSAPPPNAPHVWGRATTNLETAGWFVGCTVGGGIGLLGTALYEIVTKAEGANWGAIAAGAAAACAGAGAGTAVMLTTKDQVHIWYPTDANGQANPDSSTWYKCTDIKVYPYNSGVASHFQYPSDYPDLGGQVHDFVRKCAKF